MQCVGNFVRADRYIFRQARQNIAPANKDSFFPCAGISRADFDFDIFRRALAYHQVIFFLDIKFYIAVEFVARHAQTFSDNYSAQRNNRDIASPAANIHNH